MSNTADHGT
jgi:tRNA dimethylallyltransferase